MAYRRQASYGLKWFLEAYRCILACLIPVLLAACSNLTAPEHATPYPTEYLPTVIALTLGANESTGTPAAETPSGFTITPTPAVTLTASQTPPPPTPTLQPTESAATLDSSPSAIPMNVPTSATITTPADIPNALLEIRNLGPLSKVTSPLHLYAYVKTGAGGRVLIELLGEDNRILYRELKVIDYVKAGASAILSTDMDFEIASIAEMGRLRVSIEDEYKRTVAINSVPLVLLSIGDPDIIPPIDVLSPIVIQQPASKALIQGGKVLVTGLARSGGLGTLMVKLVTTEGREVGSRLVGVQTPPEGGFGTFAIEVAYNVSQPTAVLLVVNEGAQSMNDLIYLSSLEFMVSP